MKPTIIRILLVLAFVASGCDLQTKSSETVTPATTSKPDCNFIKEWNFAPNRLDDSREDFKPISWKTYSKIYSIPSRAVSRISIQYYHASLRSDLTKCHEIRLVSGQYMTWDGTVVDKDKVQAFAGSFSNLRLSSGMKVCEIQTDYYSMFDIEIEYQNGRKAYLYTASNCTDDRSPWNIVYDGKSYFQGTGEIPGALYALIESFDQDVKNWWKPIPEATSMFSDGSRFSLVSRMHPVGADWFSDADVLQEHMQKLKVTSPYTKEFTLGELGLKCLMHTDCSMMESKIQMDMGAHATFRLDLQFTGNDVTVLNPVPAEDLADIGKSVLAHPLLKTTGIPDSETQLRIYCRMETNCQGEDWCIAAVQLLERPQSSEELICSVQFNDQSHYRVFRFANDLYYFPQDDLFWVKDLEIGLGNARPSMQPNSAWKGLDVRIFTGLFITEAYPAIVNEIGDTIEVEPKTGQCNSISLNYNRNGYIFQKAKKNNPGLLSNLSVAFTDKFGIGNISTTTEGSIEVFGYCVFISPDGEFILYQP